MSKSWSLKRTVQCAKCPWRKGVDPHSIPNGYSEAKHRALKDTIANAGSFCLPGGVLRMMSCHEHPVGKEVPCVGWLDNQLGPGNNIALRIQMLDCENLRDLKLDGPQHERFEQTLPKRRRRVAK